MKTESMITIGKVASLASVKIETVRHYQRIGLIEEPPKPQTGYRYYSPDIVDRILFIKRSQQLGFTLKEIGELLALENAHCDDVKALAESKKAKIEKHIKDLVSIRSVLDEMINTCNANTNKVKCTMIQSLKPTNTPTI
jgi:MerR family transcriptional regulator, mercuric resistance operon regulatory protein